MTETDTAAAKTLTGILSGLEATSSRQDDRMREAIHAAAKALKAGSDPLEAVAKVYGGHGTGITKGPGPKIS